MDPKEKDYGYDSTNNSEAGKNDLFTIMDDFAKAVEIFTGFRQQFVAAGWSEANAELMVLQIMKGYPPQPVKE